MVANNECYLCILLNNYQVSMLIEKVNIRFDQIHNLHGLFRYNSLRDINKEPIGSHCRVKMDKAVCFAFGILSVMFLYLFGKLFCCFVKTSYPYSAWKLPELIIKGWIKTVQKNKTVGIKICNVALELFSLYEILRNRDKIIFVVVPEEYVKISVSVSLIFLCRNAKCVIFFYGRAPESINIRRGNSGYLTDIILIQFRVSAAYF